MTNNSRNRASHSKAVATARAGIAWMTGITISFHWLLVATAHGMAAPRPVEPRPEMKPNILMIMIDDLGWMDLAVQGNPLVETPNIDRFAGQGMRFTDAYAAAPVCSPTRAAIMTGLSPARLHITNHTPDQKRFIPDHATLMPAPMLDHLPLKHVTIAEQLRGAGYQTAFMGKWHLSGPNRGRPELEPTAQGFDSNLGGCGYGGPPTFFDPYRIPNLPDRQKGEYLPDRLADEAIEFLRDAGKRPFFLCLWTYTVHWPMEAPAALLEKYADRVGPGLNDTRYGAMIEAMDGAIGRVLDELDQIGLGENTLVVFTSDNGGFGGVADNRPLRAEKGYLYEGGIRVPLIVRWPGVVKPGSVSGVPVISMDFYPTFMEVAGIGPRIPVDTEGESLLPLLNGTGRPRRKAVFFHYPNYAFHRSNRLGSAMRAGRHKLIEYFDDGSLELYDLLTDPGETKNLASNLPAIADRMRMELAAWRRDVGAAMPTPMPMPTPESGAAPDGPGGR